MFNAPAWIFWLVGTLGIGGTIAALIFAPAIAVPLVQAAWRGFLACVPCQLVACVVAGLVFGEMAGFDRAAKQCHEAELRAELAAKQRDIDNATRAAADADERATTIAQAATKRQLEDGAYIDDLKRHATPDACRLTRDDLRGLREQPDADRTEPQPAGNAGVHGRGRGAAPAPR